MYLEYIDSYTRDMLFENILNEYSDAEQVDIIGYLVECLRNNQTFGMEKGSIEELYYKELTKILKDIKKMQQKEEDFYKKRAKKEKK